MRTIGLIKERKTPPDERVALTPEQCRDAMNRYPDLKIVVERSEIRAFSDEDYLDEGIEVVEDVSNADILIGVKEVPQDALLPNKTYLFFSHTIKEQAYNRELLRTILAKKICLIDHEALTYPNGSRVLGFGRYAGIVGAYNAFLTWGLKTASFKLMPAHECTDLKELEQELGKIALPENLNILLTGSGRVAGGVLEVLKRAQIQKVSPSAFLSGQLTGRVYTQLAVQEYNTPPMGTAFDKAAFYADPSGYGPGLAPYLMNAHIYISGHYWDQRAPKLIERKDLEAPDLQLKVVADISCDINDPIACTVRPSTIEDPIYGYHRFKHRECDPMDPNAIAVMAVDNLPCELPRDASEGFGGTLLEHVIPELIDGPSEMIDGATIAKNGSLTEQFKYLQGFVNG